MHSPFDHQSVQVVRRLWRAVGAVALVGAGLSAANCLTGCTNVYNDTFVQAHKDGGADASLENGGDADGGGKPGKPGPGSSSTGGKPSHGSTGGTGGAATGADLPDGGTDLADAGMGSSGADAGAASDAGHCLDANWSQRQGKCCFTLAGAPSILDKTVVLSGEAQGEMFVDMSRGYSNKIAFASLKNAQLSLAIIASPPYANAILQPSSVFVFNANTNTVDVWVTPKDMCNASVPPGGVLRLTYTVVYN